MRRVLVGLALAALLATLFTAAAAEPAAAKKPPDETWDFVFLGQTRPVLIRLHIAIDGRPLAAVWGDFVDAYFKSLDRNGDGVLTSDEVQGMPPPSFFFGGGGQLDRFIVRQGGARAGKLPGLEPNKEGKVTRDELAKYFRNRGGSPLQVRLGNNAAMNGYRLYIDGLNQALSSEEANRLLFVALDTNKDGKLSRAELAAGEALLRKRDANDDEMLSPEELTPNNLPASNDGMVTVFAFVPDGNLNASNEPLLPVGKGADAALAQRLLAHYAPTSKGKPETRKLTRHQIGLDAATFKLLDTDGDGSLDASELARFGSRAPDVELAVDLKGDAKPEVKVLNAASSPVARSIRQDRENPFSIDLGTTRLTLGLPLGTAGGAVVRFGSGFRENYLRDFKNSDRDGNGYLDADEAKNSRLIGGLFKLLDRAGTGKVFEKDLIAYLDRMEDLQKRAARAQVTLGLTPQSSGLFDLADVNHDGRLSVRELRQLPKLLESLDRNGDGFISADEVPRTYRMTLQTGSGGGVLDIGGNFVFLANGMQAAAPPAPSEAGPLWFRKMDRNRDGDVSRKEFLGTDEEFRKIDTDGDGLISLEEAIAAEKLFRKNRPGKGR
jgi:Ca2+-binding EF-hand superfamily protein